MDFDEIFQKALGPGSSTFEFQRRIALDAQLPCLVRVPTGLGKTAAVVLGWLWRRFFAGDEMRGRTPRRLIYCLPMRTLVEQTAENALLWRDRLGLSDRLGIHLLMGGEEASNWDLYPEKEAILIGTQDMLLSGALNRGYAMSCYRWPMPFGLLNNDCLWAFDEVQLMDAGVATSTQMDAFRRTFGTNRPVPSIWVSATLQESWLDTVDFRPEWLGEPLELGPEDLANETVQKRYGASKPIEKSSASNGDPPGIAQQIAARHQKGTKTLAVFNTVKRAIEVYTALRKVEPTAPVTLLHSRFRQPDRDEALALLLDDDAEVIAITTQILEAGVDVSATTLFTELAPWASLVQRFGRCNRKGEDSTARVIWLDLKADDAAPYEAEELARSREALKAISNVSPKAMDGMNVEMLLDAPHVIRRRDLIDLFDTTPDLAGSDIDISRFIRSGEDRDVQIYWRDFPAKETPEEGRPEREELCRVPAWDFRDQFWSKKHRDDVWGWDGLERAWRKVDRDEIYPGQVFLVRAEAGGYDSEIGWAPMEKGVVDVKQPTTPEHDSVEKDFEDGPWLTIAEHTDDVVQELESILQALALSDYEAEALRQAARWHDWGKAHPEFQAAVTEDGRPEGWQGRRDVAKAPFWSRYKRSGFRHEFASALGMLEIGKPDLSVYLAAAHHGKVRLSIRSLPNEKRPHEPGRLYARGVWDGEALPSVDLGGGVQAPETVLSLEPMLLGRSADGRPSWAERMLRVRDQRGPFRLAYLEALLRAADRRASRAEAAQAGVDGDE